MFSCAFFFKLAFSIFMKKMMNFKEAKDFQLFLALLEIPQIRIYVY
jgi:hypothetical protein